MSNHKGNIKHGHHGTLTYSRWKSMNQRCNNPKASNYQYYGGRGITVWEPWRESFATFLGDMGECPEGMTLERLDNSIGYRPDNCIWATQAQQNKNRSHCVSLTFNGITKNVTDWAAEIGISANTLNQRLYAGWSVERALTTPAGSSKADKHPHLNELTHNGETKPLIAWAESIGITPNALRQRLRLGWSVERALSKPLKKRTVQ